MSALSALLVLARVALWLAVALVLVRGTLDIVRTTNTDAPMSVSGDAEAERLFPDTEALAFAVGFARAYLTFSSTSAEQHARALEHYLAPTLEHHGGLAVPVDGHQSVAHATVARVQRLDVRRALVTVAADLEGAVGNTRYLTVPVASDASGALAVFAYPAFAPAPRHSLARNEEDFEALDASERSGIEALLRRFFPAYLAGPAEAVTYFASPGVRLDAVVGPYADVELVTVSPVARPRSSHVLVAADVRARDSTNGALYLLRYRVLLERDERWYVDAVNTDSKGSS